MKTTTSLLLAALLTASLLSCGGESTDKDIRAEQGLYWKEELPTPREMAEGAAKLDEVGCEVDYIITHEPPKRVKSAMLLRGG